MNKGRPGSAVALFQRALRDLPLAPSLAWRKFRTPEELLKDDLKLSLHHHLARSLVALRRFEDAIAAYNDAMRLTPHCQDVPLCLAAAIRPLPSGVWSVPARQAAERTPESPDARTALGRAHLLEGNLVGAKEGAADALELDPDHADAHFLRGEVHAAVQDWPGATAALREALRRNPAHLKASRLLSHSLMAEGDLEGAHQCLEEARERTPKSAITCLGLAHLASDMGNLEAACGWYEKVLSITVEEQPQVEIDNLRDALAFFGADRSNRKATPKKQVPEVASADLWFARAEVHMRAHRPEAALPLIRAALDLDPDSERGQQLLERARRAARVAEVPSSR
jgi:tetratricopeptide (TPR) repeat protein